MWLALMVSTWMAPAHACVGIVHTPQDLAATAGQQMIFEREGTGSAVTYRVFYEGDATTFGWVIPVPGEVTAVADADATRFDDLDDTTKPSVFRVSFTGVDEPTGCSCLGGPKAGGDLQNGLEEEDLGVTILAEGVTATYAWTALDAEVADDLETWLSDNGFTAGIPEGTLDAYVGAGAWRFVAIRLDQDAALDAGAEATLPPVKISYDSTVLAYPAQMARLMSGQRYRATAWVLGPERASVSPWEQQDLTYVEGESDAVAAFDQALYEAAGDTPAWSVVWAGRWADGWATRFDTYLDAEAHTSDPGFRFDGGSTATDCTIELWATVDTDGSGAALLFPLVGGLAWRRRRS